MDKIIDKQLAIKLLTNMQLSRKFEETIKNQFKLGNIHGTIHLSIGEEASSSGSCAALLKSDEIYVNHRGHGQAICKGLDINSAMAELFGKITGCCKGKGGSMHIADKDAGVLVANGILGANLPIACGTALAHKKRNDGVVTTVFFGDGSCNEGVLFEAFNLASIWNLPIIFVCTNNTYGISTHISKVMKSINIEDRAKPFLIESKTVDGNDVLAVYDSMVYAREYVLTENAPIFIVHNTYRTDGHSKSDKNLYRTQEEIDYWKEKCPINNFIKKVLECEILTKEDVLNIDFETSNVLEEAVLFALNSEKPELTEISTHIYKN